MPINSHSAKQDKYLLSRVAKGDESAFEQLYDSYNIPIYNYLVRLTHKEAIAENLLQETFLAVWESAGKFRGEAQVKSWIYRISHNKAVTWLRKTNKDEIPRELPLNEAHLQEKYTESPEGAIIREGQEGNVRRALESLSAKHRAVVELAYVHEFSYREIARIVDCPEGTVKSRMNYALRQLNGIFKQMGTEESNT
ncbi:MAG: hypothetical protein DRI56_10285 [Chloroflexota bacterium]|nr:MAG: hypothetical protein DRI56_10285 [Chloroflexota bacterium]